MNFGYFCLKGQSCVLKNQTVHKMSSAVEQVSKILEEWDRENISDETIINCLSRLADLFEEETEAFLKKDPDPFDDRHPSRLLPDCTLGHMLKTVFKNERIVDEMVKVYSQRDVFELNLMSCRLLLDILPGLESVVFQEEGFVSRLFHWAEKAENPLQSYATGLLAAAMDSPEIAAQYKDRNAYFVPLMIRRLHDCSQRYLRNPVSDGTPIPERPFACLGGKYDYNSFERGSSLNEKHKDSNPQKATRKQKEISKSARYSPFPPDARNHRKITKASPVKNSLFNEGSNSNWTELEQYVIGQYQVYPLTLPAEQRYILQYLTPMGEYQEALAPIFEEKALPLILRYIDIHQNPDVRLSFEALKYLASLLCHKKIAIEFINIGGLQLLLKVPFPSIAATGVSICLYYLAYIEEVMEKICLMNSVISELVSYALWLLECSHDSSRCHATMFFECAFAFKIILDNFDEQDGLRKLFNVMSTLEMFVQNSNRTLSDDQIFANRQTTRHVCGALKRYFEAHLVTEVERVNRLSTHRSDVPKTKQYKALNLSSEAIDSYCEMWRDIVPLNANWKPVDDFIHLEAITFLLDLIASYFELSYSGRAETVKCALDVLKICSLTSATQLLLCERLTSQEYSNATGVLVLLQAIDEDILPVPDIQRAALHCIINLVCTKIPTDKDISNTSKLSITPKKKSSKSVEELLNKLWKNVRIKNGINVLINLLGKKTPLTDADSIRALACQALCGLSRSETVKQIISKLPLVTDGLLLEYMKQPVLQDKGHEHVKFCKFGLELIARVTSAPVNDGSESSMLNINKSEIVAKTKIMYNEAQLLQLISDHLSLKGFDDTVACLQKEMAEKNICPQPLPSHPLQTLITNASKNPAPSHVNTPIRNFRSSEAFSSPNCPTTPTATIPPPSIPLKIVVNKKLMVPETKHSSPSRLQKQEKCSGSYVQTPAMKRQGGSNYPYGDAQPIISLESIISEYLRKQHALCKNPMLACPPFDLYAPHKCPEAKNKTNAPVNCVLRIHKKMYSNVGYGASSLDRKFIYSKYRLVRTFRDEEEGRFDFSCCSFLKFGDSRNQPRIIIGTLGALGNTAGRLKSFNINTGEEVFNRDAHMRGVNNIQSSKFTPLTLTSDVGRIGHSALWSADGFEIVREFNEVPYMEYGKTSAARLVGTKHDSAMIFDTNTGSVVEEFKNGDLGNQYNFNKSTFDYRDELVLSDGLLWDVRGKEVVHKLDKFNANENGVFHPNGREIISNSEIWDLRTFKLLRTVVGLDMCKVVFNDIGTVLYGAYHTRESNEERNNCFYTFNADDYSPIATIDVKRPLFQVAVDCNEKYIATIESQFAAPNDEFLPPANGVDCVCRLYEIGRTKEEGDEDGEESDSEEETDDDDDDDDIVEFDEELGNDDDNQNDDDDIIFDMEDAGSYSTISLTDSSDEDDTLFSLNTSMDD
ncbi:hypothetical protein JTE90_026814 [Oedothorax gibbosus]|uniref:LisH domain-containing protein n=1 Tax=Oedothorax gibbosus TaxID=931172 RepID=A0AAV6V5E9_9ARAC|nr:hypothetical protein JTE90_026814 [Oedothorax gibbosus]